MFKLVYILVNRPKYIFFTIANVSTKGRHCQPVRIKHDWNIKKSTFLRNKLGLQILLKYMTPTKLFFIKKKYKSVGPLVLLLYFSDMICGHCMTTFI